MVDRYLLEASAGNGQSGEYIISKFGHSTNVGTSPTPIAHGNIYRTPQVSGATALRVKAGDANDTAAGTGAREVTLQGIGPDGSLITESLATAGASASSNTVYTFIRLFRIWVSKSGTYGTQSANSHAADIVIENAAGTQDWGTIDLDANGFADGQSEIGVYTVPLGKQAYLLDVKYSVDTTKTTKLFFYKRENILEIAAPYTAIRKQFGVSSAIRDGEYVFEGPIVFPELTDVGFVASIDAGTASVSVEFNLLIRNKE